MNEERIFVANLKCKGCATTVEKALLRIRGVKSVVVDPGHDSVDVSYENVGRDVIIGKLHSLGYPEATEENGLLLQLKSLASCMIGRINNTSGRKAIG